MYFDEDLQNIRLSMSVRWVQLLVDAAGEIWAGREAARDDYEEDMESGCENDEFVHEYALGVARITVSVDACLGAVDASSACFVTRVARRVGSGFASKVMFWRISLEWRPPSALGCVVIFCNRVLTL